MARLEYGTTKYREAQAKILAHVRAAYAAIEEAQKVSDASGIPFDFELTYGMGGTYVPETAEYRYSTTGWNASSQSC